MWLLCLCSHNYILLLIQRVQWELHTDAEENSKQLKKEVIRVDIVRYKMKSTKLENPRRNKCSAVVQKNCLVAKYLVPYRIGPRTIIINNCC